MFPEHNPAVPASNLREWFGQGVRVIPEELRAKAFDSFVTTKSDGPGLGLSLCKRFVESHGGQLELMPRNGQPGACFQIRLPVLEQKTSAVILAEPALA